MIRLRLLLAIGLLATTARSESIDLADLAWARLRPGGRLVAHAVTLSAEAVLVAAHQRHGGHLTRMTVEHAAPLGPHLSWTPARAIVQWSAQKPPEQGSP